MKNNKGFAPIALVLAILAVLAIGGGAYYVRTQSNYVSKYTDSNNVQPVGDQSQDNSTQSDFKIFKNTSAGYSINYRSNWIITSDSNSPVETRLPEDRQGTPPMFNNFQIANMKGAVKQGSDFEMESKGSIIDVQVTHGIKYSTIDDMYKDGNKYGLPVSEIQERLAKINNMNIGGKNLRVWYGKGSLDEGYAFLYNGRQYSLNFNSGSQAQYDKDLKVFNDLVTSFVLIDSNIVSFNENSSTEIFKFQPGAIKSITANGNNKWILDVDLLSQNPNFLPGVGGPAGDFFINQNSKIRTLSVTSNTKAYNCGIVSADVVSNISDFITKIQNDMVRAKLENQYRIGGPLKITDWKFWETAYFDISGTNITAMYQQCLP
ncbi:MAG: PsbP-related protein [Candidatus Paceibacterota bacterium]